MPHYRDGTEAKVGDQVTGKLYNTDGVRAGTIISITPGSDSCNAMVAFIEAVPGASAKPPRMAAHDPDVSGNIPSDPPRPRSRCVSGENHGTTGPVFTLFECVDYCAVNELTKVP